LADGHSHHRQGQRPWNLRQNPKVDGPPGLALPVSCTCPKCRHFCLFTTSSHKNGEDRAS
jgi:hypothetical protein